MPNLPTAERGAPDAAPGNDPTRNAELLMQVAQLSGKHAAQSHSGKTQYPAKRRAVLSHVEVARCMFTAPRQWGSKELRAPWGAITVPDLQTWHARFDDRPNVGASVATRAIRGFTDMAYAYDNTYEIQNGSFGRKAPIVYHGQHYPYACAMLLRFGKMLASYENDKDVAYDLVESMHAVDPARVQQIFNNPEAFAFSDAFDYDAVIDSVFGPHTYAGPFAAGERIPALYPPKYHLLPPEE